MRYDEESIRKWNEYEEECQKWENNPVVQLTYYKDDAFTTSEGKYYHVCHFASYVLDAEKDIELLRRIKSLNPRVITNTSFLELPETVLLKEAPGTVEETVELVEKYLEMGSGKSSK